MLKKISKDFPEDPLTEEKIRQWLDDIGLGGKLVGFEDPTTFFDFAACTLDDFVRITKIPEDEGGSLLWLRIKRVKQERGKCS